MKKFVSICLFTVLFLCCKQKESKQPEPAQPKHDTTGTGIQKPAEPAKLETVSAPNDLAFRVAENVAGPLKLKMELEQARKAFHPPFSIGKGQDGFEGDIMYPVNEGTNRVMTLRVYQNQVSDMDVTDSRYHTKEGVHVGMLLQEAEQKLGKLTSIDIGEQDDKEYAVFSAYRGVRFRLAGEIGKRAGIYAPEKYTTTRYKPDAKIAALFIENME
jgi:hypothetical protein